MYRYIICFSFVHIYTTEVLFSFADFDSVQQNYCFHLNLSSSRCSPVGSLFTSGDQKGLAHDIIYTAATHVSLAQDVTHTDCQISTLQHLQLYFRDIEMSFFNKLGHKMAPSPPSPPPFLLIGPIMLFTWFPCK